jgi:hypothetical protein
MQIDTYPAFSSGEFALHNFFASPLIASMRAHRPLNSFRNLPYVDAAFEKG